MRRLTKAKLEEILTRRLKLKNPHFRLEKYGSRILGSVIDDRFARWDSLRRQTEIWNALEAELGADSNKLVGMILAYTVKEWDLPLEGLKRRKVVAG